LTPVHSGERVGIVDICDDLAPSRNSTEIIEIVNISVTNKWPQFEWHMAVSRADTSFSRSIPIKLSWRNRKSAVDIGAAAIGIVGTTTGTTACDGPPSMPTATADSEARFDEGMKTPRENPPPSKR
jgi:hypothetical protein